MRTPRRYATQADVARLAGVSRPTVSLVVKGSPHVSPAKRERVLAAIEQLGYVHNALASTLAGHRSSLTVGLLLQSLSNPVFIGIYEGIDAVMSPRGHRLIVMRGGLDHAEEDTALRTLTSLRPDGIMLAGYAGSTEALHRALRAVPAVSVTREILPPRDRSAVGTQVCSVSNDDAAGGRLATEHLLGLGHRRIVHLQLVTGLPTDGRSEAYAAVMAQAGLPVRMVPCPVSVPEAAGLVASELRGGDPPTAFFCGNDVQALGALDAVRAAGLVPGRDVSVVGYDDTAIGARAGLTSVDQHARELGSLAAQAMLDALGAWDGPLPALVPPPPELRVRSSSGPAGQAQRTARR